jgi:hypothetical protein
MTEPIGTKKQHFVPQLLLRQFADSREHLFAYDMVRNVSFGNSVQNSGHQNHFLSIPALDGTRGAGAYFESLFQTYEGPAINAIRSIQTAIAESKQPVVGSAEREDLARFIGVQYLRTPAARTLFLQFAGVVKHSLASEIAKRNDFDVTDPAIQDLIREFSSVPASEQAEFHGDLIKPDFISELADVLSGHVWLLGTNDTGSALYVADNPVALHLHVPRPGRGTGLGTYAVEVQFPLSSRLQLSMIDRSFVRKEIPQIEANDGAIYLPLTPENVEFQRSLQVNAASRFIYCEDDDFAIARLLCSTHPELRDPARAMVDGYAFGERVTPHSDTKPDA